MRLANDASHGDQLLTLLADWDGERATLDDRAGGASTPRVARQRRRRRSAPGCSGGASSSTAGGRVEHNDSFGTAAVPRGSVVFVAHEGERARRSATRGCAPRRASASRSRRSLQSFSPSPFFRGNPDLLPERSRTVEAGIEQRLCRDRARVEATWFDNRYREPDLDAHDEPCDVRRRSTSTSA